MTAKIVREDGVTEIENIKSCVYTEKVNADTDLRPGCVSSAMIEVEVYGAQSSAPASGEALTYYQVDSEGNETLIGVFYAEPTIPSKATYSFAAYDAVSKLDVDFSAWLSANQTNFPMTVYALVSAACTTAGVTLASASWDLSTMQVQAFYADGLTCRNILQYAAEIACCFVRCNTAGGLVFDWYSAASGYQIYPGGETTGTDTYIPYTQGGLTYDNYNTATLDRVCVHPVGEDDVAYIYPDVSIGNTLNITNNVLLTGASASVMNAVAQNIYNAMSALGSYRPARINLFPFLNPFRAGDIVTVTDIQGVTFTTIVMSMTTSANGATLESTGNEEYNDYASNVQKAIVQLASDIVRINKLKVDWADIGTAIVETLEAEGINADWINAGSLTVKDANNHILFQADKDSRLVTIGGLLAGYGLMADYQNLFSLEGATVINLVGEEIGLTYNTQYGPDGIEFTFDNGQPIETNNSLSYYIKSGNVLGLDPGLSGFTIGADDAVYIRVPTAANFIVECDPVYGIHTKRAPLTEIGTLSSLTTSAKSSLVAAINELVSGKVSKAGDAMTGALTMNNNAAIVSKNTNATIGSPPSSGNQNWNGIQFVDSAGTSVVRVRAEYTSTDRVQLSLFAAYNGVYNGVVFGIDGSGNSYVSLNSPSAWLTALGLNVTTGTITISSGTLDTGYLRKSGNVVVCAAVTAGSAVTTAWATIGSIPAGYRPSDTVSCVGLAGYTPIHVRVDSGGNIQVRGGSAMSNQTIRFNLSWMI